MHAIKGNEIKWGRDAAGPCATQRNDRPGERPVKGGVEVRGGLGVGGEMGLSCGVRYCLWGGDRADQRHQPEECQRGSGGRRRCCQVLDGRTIGRCLSVMSGAG